MEELQRHMAENKPAMVYFSDVNAPPATGGTPQYQALAKFRDDWCRPRGLLESYKSHDEFKEKFRRHLATKINDDLYFAPREMPTAREPHNPSFFEISDRLGRGESFHLVRSVPDLSPEAKTLLIEAAKDKGGNIICRNVVSTGWQLQTNGKQFVEAGVPRSRARWQVAVEQLVTSQLIEEQTARGLYQLTNAGYEAADILSRQ